MGILRAFAVGTLLAALAAAQSVRAEEAQPDFQSAAARHAARLEALAEWCENHHLGAEAAETRRWLLRFGARSQAENPDDQPLVLFIPEGRDPTSPTPGGGSNGDKPSDVRRQWRQRFGDLRREYAERLFALAKEGLAGGKVTLAHSLLWEAVWEDPDHGKARRALGFARHEGQWLTGYAAEQARAGRLWHARFGWIAAADRSRYERGERPSGGGWVSAEQDARRRTGIQNGWKVETDHYVVTTNHSLEEAARLAAELEIVHCAWRQVFAGYWLASRELMRRMETAQAGSNDEGGKSAPERTPASAGAPAASEAAMPTARKHKVVCFRSREEYVRALRPRQPRVEISLGTYLDADRTVYLFAGAEQDRGTLVHEATHQLFKESRAGGAARPGLKDNFWIVEGVACYMESLRSVGSGSGLYLVGGRGAGRLPAARERVEDGFYVPLAQLVALGTETLQRDPDIPKIYSQAAGLTAFLIHVGSGRHREPLNRYLEAVYGGKATLRTLSDVLDEPFAALDRQYREFVLGRANRH